MEFCNVLIKKFKIPEKHIEMAVEDLYNNFEIFSINEEAIKYALKIRHDYHFSLKCF